MFERASFAVKKVLSPIIAKAKTGTWELRADNTGPYFTDENGTVKRVGEGSGGGTSATITVGTVTTLPAGSNATVTNSGTESAAVFNFGIPKGADGSSATTSNPWTISNLGTYDSVSAQVALPLANGTCFYSRITNVGQANVVIDFNVDETGFNIGDIAELAIQYISSNAMITSVRIKIGSDAIFDYKFNPETKGKVIRFIKDSTGLFYMEV